MSTISSQPLPNADIELMQKRRAKVTMMWVGIVSIVMLFAGFTSGFILSMGRKDWVSVTLPPAFITSTIIIIISSLTMFAAQYAVKKGNKGGVVGGLLLTLALGIGFAISQYLGFKELFAQGHSFVSKNPADSWTNMIPFMHLLHVAGGLLALFVTFIQASRGKYTAENYLGLRLTAIYWHFLDILWLYLYVFLYLIR